MPFVKGQKSANPKGRTPGSFSLVDMLRRKLQEIPEGEKESYADQLIKSYIDEAKTGKSNLITDAMDRIDGKPKQSVGVEGNGEDGSIEIRIKMV